MSNESNVTPGVTTEKTGSILRVTMSSPGKKNAIDTAMYLGLANALTQAANDSSIRVVLLRGADGDFTSGNVVDDFENTAKGENPPVVSFLDALINFPKPIVAQVEGVAIGVGATMLMHCDVIYAAEGTRFRLPFVNLGLVPEAGASYLLPRLMGQAKAAELLLLGRMFSAEEAVSAGLVSRVLSPDALEDAVESVAQELCELPPNALMKTKALLRAPLVGNLWDRVADELTQFADGLEQEEFKEAYAAFAEKRKPVFK